MWTFRKISIGLWKGSFSLKHEVLSEYSNPVLSFIFSKSHFLKFFMTYNNWCVSRSWCFLLTQRSFLGEPFKYLEHSGIFVWKTGGNVTWQTVMAFKVQTRLLPLPWLLIFFLSFWVLCGLKCVWSSKINWTSWNRLGV